MPNEGGVLGTAASEAATAALDNDSATAMAIQIRDTQAALSLGADPVVIDLEDVRREIQGGQVSVS